MAGILSGRRRSGRSNGVKMLAAFAVAAVGAAYALLHEDNHYDWRAAFNDAAYKDPYADPVATKQMPWGSMTLYPTRFCTRYTGRDCFEVIARYDAPFDYRDTNQEAPFPIPTQAEMQAAFEDELDGKQIVRVRGETPYRGTYGLTGYTLETFSFQDTLMALGYNVHERKDLGGPTFSPATDAHLEQFQEKYSGRQWVLECRYSTDARNDLLTFARKYFGYSNILPTYVSRYWHQEVPEEAEHSFVRRLSRGGGVHYPYKKHPFLPEREHPPFKTGMMPDAAEKCREFWPYYSWVSRLGPFKDVLKPEGVK
jgi:hypothetical protein